MWNISAENGKNYSKLSAVFWFILPQIPKVAILRNIAYP